MKCDNCGAGSRAYEGERGAFCSADCQHAAECRGDGTCCSLPDPGHVLDAIDSKTS